MSTFKTNLIEAYGLDEVSNLENENFTKEHLRVAFFNLSMTMKDGIPAQIPGFDYLYVGSIGSAYNLKALQHCGITHILCLSDVIKTQYEHHFNYLRVPMKDQPDFDIAVSMQQCNEFITTAQLHVTAAGDKGKVLVHCYQGKSRSVAVCCAHMMKSTGTKYSEALATIRTVRPIAAPNSGFERTLLRMQESGNNADEK